MSTAHGGHGGAIVNISSVATEIGSPGQYVDYAASKGAIERFTIGLAKEVATEGIRVKRFGRASSTPRSTPPAACRTGHATRANRADAPRRHADEVADADALALVRLRLPI